MEDILLIYLLVPTWTTIHDLLAYVHPFKVSVSVEGFVSSISHLPSNLFIYLFVCLFIYLFIYINLYFLLLLFFFFGIISGHHLKHPYPMNKERRT